MALVEAMIAGRVSSVSITDRSSAAWTIEQVVWVTKSKSAAFGRLRLSSVKLESMPPPSFAPGKAARAAAGDRPRPSAARAAWRRAARISGRRRSRRRPNRCSRPRALRSRGDGLQSDALGVDLVGNDDLKDDLRGGGFADLPILSNSETAALVPHIGMTDEEARLQRTQGVNGGGRRFDLIVRQRDAEFGHPKRKVSTQFDRDRDRRVSARRRRRRVP